MTVENEKGVAAAVQAEVCANRLLTDASRRQRLNEFLVPFVCVLTALIYGVWSLVGKEAVSLAVVKPLVFAFYRSAGGACVMLVAAHFVPKEGRPYGLPAVLERGHVPRFIILGALQAGNMGGYLMAIDNMSPVTVTTFQPLIPVVAGAASALLGIEDLSPLKVLGILMCAAGAMVVVVFGEQAASPGSHENLVRGIPCLMLQVASGALYMVLQKAVLGVYPPVFVAALAFVVASLPLFVGACTSAHLSLELWTMGGNTTALACLTYAVFMNTAFTYSALAWANRESSPSFVASFSTVQPLFSAVFAWLTVGTIITWGQGVGACAIAGGLLLFLRSQRPEDRQPLLPAGTLEVRSEC